MQKTKDHNPERKQVSGYSFEDGDGNEAINIARLDVITDGNEDDRNEFCAIYMKQAEASVEDLRSGLETGNEDLWKKAAHKLKGSSQTFGAERLSALCYRAEMEFKAKADEKKTMLGDICKEFDRVKDCVADILSP